MRDSYLSMVMSELLAPADRSTRLHVKTNELCYIEIRLPIMNLADEAFWVCMVFYFISVLVVSWLLCSLVTCVLKLLFAMYFLCMGLYTRFFFYYELAQYPFLILSLTFFFFFSFFFYAQHFFGQSKWQLSIGTCGESGDHPSIRRFNQNLAGNQSKYNNLANFLFHFLTSGNWKPSKWLHFWNFHFKFM